MSEIGSLPRMGTTRCFRAVGSLVPGINVPFKILIEREEIPADMSS